MTDSRHIELGWQSTVVPCQGGLLLNIDALTQGTQYPGSARILQNYESSLNGGYRRMNGYIKYDTNVVPGDANNPVLGVKVALGGVFAVRKTSTDNRVYFSTGAGWGTKLNASARTGAVSKARFITYNLVQPTVLMVDGVNFAWTYNASSGEAQVNGTGAPQGAKYCAFWNNHVVLAGYGNGQKLSISAPNTDSDFDGAHGAIEINVGATIEGIKEFRETLVVFTNNKVKNLTGFSTQDYQLVDVASQMGSEGQDTIQEIAGDLIWFSSEGFRSYAATTKLDDESLDSVSQSIQPLVSDTLAEGIPHDSYSSLCVRSKGQYRLYLNDPNRPTNATGGYVARVQDTPIIPHGQYEWSTMLGVKPYCCDSDYNGSANIELAVLGDPKNGLVYRLESGNDFDGVPMQAIYKSPDLTFADATLRKVFQRATINTEVEGDFDTVLSLILDKGGTNVIQPPSITLAQSGSIATYGAATSIYGTSLYSEFFIPTFRQTLVGSGFTGAFQFFSEDSNAPYRIDSYQIEFTMKSRR